MPSRSKNDEPVFRSLDLPDVIMQQVLHAIAFSKKPITMERSFARSMKSLDDVFAFVSDFFNSRGVSATAAFSIRFAIEELFTNLVKYNKNGKSDISVGLSVQGTNLVVHIKDIEEHPFDPTNAPDPDIHAPLENRRPGGLGIFLVKKMIDKVEYHHSENMSTITLVHSLEK